MIEIEEKTDSSPMCPFCKVEVKKVFYQKMAGFFGKRYIYFCEHCKSILGVSHRKGFWMG